MALPNAKNGDLSYASRQPECLSEAFVWRLGSQKLVVALLRGCFRVTHCGPSLARRRKDVPALSPEQVDFGRQHDATPSTQTILDDVALQRNPRSRLRILFAVAHYYRKDNKGPYGSRMDRAADRTAAVEACVTSVHRVFGRKQEIIDWSRAAVVPANHAAAHDIEIVVCTTRGDHLLNRARLRGLYRHHRTRAEPMLLGFECHAVLRDRLGSFDYYCFLEDDCVFHDPQFFTKLDWFNDKLGPEGLLQPQRFELGPRGKLYVDGDIPLRYTEPYQDLRERPVVVRRFAGSSITLRRAKNPHAGAFFLNREQMKRWAARRDFLDRDTSFVGPLESAASLSIMKAFRVYKPDLANANFFEIQHYGSKFCDMAARARGGR